MPDILGEHIECHHPGLVVIIDISIETLEGRGRDSLVHLLLEIDGKLLKVGRRAERLAIFLLDEYFQFFYFWCSHILMNVVLSIDLLVC